MFIGVPWQIDLNEQTIRRFLFRILGNDIIRGIKTVIGCRRAQGIHILGLLFASLLRRFTLGLILLILALLVMPVGQHLLRVRCLAVIERLQMIA